MLDTHETLTLDEAERRIRSEHRERSATLVTEYHNAVVHDEDRERTRLIDVIQFEDEYLATTLYAINQLQMLGARVLNVPLGTCTAPLESIIHRALRARLQ